MPCEERGVSSGLDQTDVRYTHLGHSIDGTTDAKDPIGDTGDDLADAGLDIRLGTKSSNGGSTATDNDTCRVRERY